MTRVDIWDLAWGRRRRPVRAFAVARSGRGAFWLLPQRGGRGSGSHLRALCKCDSTPFTASTPRASCGEKTTQESFRPDQRTAALCGKRVDISPPPLIPPPAPPPPAEHSLWGGGLGLYHTPTCGEALVLCHPWLARTRPPENSGCQNPSPAPRPVGGVSPSRKAPWVGRVERSG